MEDCDQEALESNGLFTKIQESLLQMSGMTEIMEELSGVKVKDLISAYESKSSATRIEYSRPRAKSLGNVLSKTVVVKENEVTTLDDVEKALTNFEGNLRHYSVYNKQKHVELQNQLFNILTSIGNVRRDSEDDLMMRKYLTTTTLSMVSSLNQILPSNIIPSEQKSYKYTSYETFKKQKQKNEREQGEEFELIPKQMIPATKPSVMEVDESAVSVKKLRERYQSQNRETEILEQNVITYNDEDEYRSEYSLTLKDAVGEKETSTETTTSDEKVDREYTEVDASYLEKKENKKDLSVLKLRMLFEKKSEESSRGLELVLNKTEPQYSRFKFSVTTPYLERQENEIYVRTISNEHVDQGDLSTDDPVDDSMNESNYETAYNSISEFEKDINEDIESGSGPSSSGSTASAIEIK